MAEESTVITEDPSESRVDEGGVPPENGDRQLIARHDSDEPEDIEMDFFSHLDELRRRLLRMIIWAGFGIVLCWYVTPLLMFTLTNPTYGKLEFVWKNLYDPFMMYVKVSLIGGLILFAPLLLYELWAFVAPALTRREKRFVWISLPFSIGLFFLGVLVCYFCIPLFLGFFLPFFRIGGEGSTPTIDFAAYLTFLMLCFLAFGVCFQFPLIVVFLAQLGIVDFKTLTQYRKHAYFVIVVVSSIVTPTWDPLTLMLCAIPVCLLYEISIWIVKFFIKPL